MLGYMWLHTGFIHVLENIIMLWIVGRRVSIKLGCFWYCLAYLGLGLFAAMVHLACHGQPAVGASGAVMGIFGMYVILCCRRLGRYAPFLIVCWYLLSIWVGFLGGPVRIHWTHAGSFTAGMFLAVLFMLINKAPSNDTALSLVGILDRWRCRLLLQL
jgi:membrane associated rhomboid family serine protease